MTSRTHPRPRASGATRADAHLRFAERRGWATESWRALGTSVELAVTAREALAPAQEAVCQVLADVDRAASRFRTDSDLSRLNDSAGEWREVSPMLALLLRAALDAARWTAGRVDPTVGGSLVALGYDRTFELIPKYGPALPVRIGSAPGWRAVELDDDAGRARLPAGALLDLGATAKGLAADLASDAAAKASGEGALVSLGGDVAVAGVVPAGGWPVAVVDVADPSLDAVDEGTTVLMLGGGLATSGTAARRWQRGGSMLHHLIDPRTGVPTRGPWRTVTVAASTCVLANTASTAAMVLGADAPGWLAERGFDARLVGEDKSTLLIGAWPVAQLPRHTEGNPR